MIIEFIIFLGTTAFIVLLSELFLKYLKKKQRQIDKKIKEYNESVTS
jgi:hypothetical protein